VPLILPVVAAYSATAVSGYVAKAREDPSSRNALVRCLLSESDLPVNNKRQCERECTGHAHWHWPRCCCKQSGRLQNTKTCWHASGDFSMIMRTKSTFVESHHIAEGHFKQFEEEAEEDETFEHIYENLAYDLKSCRMQIKYHQTFWGSLCATLAHPVDAATPASCKSLNLCLIGRLLWVRLYACCCSLASWFFAAKC